MLTIANNKGGVGKTTTAYYVGSELARLGDKVLLIDLDGQANLTERCFPDEGADTADDGGEHFPSIVQYFSDHHHLDDLVRPTSTPLLSIIPSDRFLRLRELGGSGRPDLETRFAEDMQVLSTLPLASLAGVPDWIIIDTPPTMSAFTRAALAAAHYVLAPIRPRRASLAGTRNMLLTLQTMDALTNTNGRFLGTVLTHWDKLVVSKQFDEVDLPRALQGNLREFGGQAFQTKIPVDNQLETLEPGMRTGGATAYEALALEVRDKVRQRSSSLDGQREMASHVVTIRGE